MRRGTAVARDRAVKILGKAADLNFWAMALRKTAKDKTKAVARMQRAAKKFHMRVSMTAKRACATKVSGNASLGTILAKIKARTRSSNRTERGRVIVANRAGPM